MQVYHNLLQSTISEELTLSSGKVGWKIAGSKQCWQKANGNLLSLRSYAGQGTVKQILEIFHIESPVLTQQDLSVSKTCFFPCLAWWEVHVFAPFSCWQLLPLQVHCLWRSYMRNLNSFSWSLAATTDTHQWRRSMTLWCSSAQAMNKYGLVHPVSFRSIAFWHGLQRHIAPFILT